MKRQSLLRLALGLCALCAAQTASALSISVFPDKRQLTPGATFQVDIQVAGVPSIQVLSGIHLLLGYDALVMQATGVTFYDVFGDPDVLEALPVADRDALTVLDFDPNTLTNADSSSRGYTGQFDTAVDFTNAILLLDPSTGGSQDDFDYLKGLQTPEPLTLATIEFELLASAPTGIFPLELMDDTFFTNLPTNFGGDYDLKGRDGEILEPLDIDNGSVSVPLPGSVFLLLSSLPALLLVRRRRG